MARCVLAPGASLLMRWLSPPAIQALESQPSVVGTEAGDPPGHPPLAPTWEAMPDHGPRAVLR